MGVALSLTVLLLVGEQALSLVFLGFLLLFALVALAFLAASHLPPRDQGAQRVAFPGPGVVLGLGGAVAAVTLLLAVAVCVALPQNHRVTAAGPLPSRLDLTSGWPAPPSGDFGGDWAPWAQFLPS